MRAREPARLKQKYREVLQHLPICEKSIKKTRHLLQIFMY